MRRLRLDAAETLVLLAVLVSAALGVAALLQH